MENYTYQLMREYEDGHWWFVARRKILRDLVSTLKLPEGSDILEVGCGTGGNIEFLQEFGFVTCVESEEVAAGIARDRKMAPIMSGRLPNELPCFEHHFDLIVLFDVIEHIEEDGESLVALSRILKPGGYIVLTVPALPALWSQHDEENHHKRRYTRGSLRNLVTSKDFSIDYISYFNFWLFPLVTVIRLFRKLFKYQESWQDMRLPNNFTNRILQSIFSSERYFIKRKVSLPVGISLMTVLSVPKRLNRKSHHTR